MPNPSGAGWLAGLAEPLQAPGQLLLQLLALAGAVWLTRLLSWRIARRLVRISGYANRARDPRPARQQTLQGLVADGISALALVTALLWAMVRLINLPLESMAWAVGLLGAGFGLAARPIISDYLAGIGFVIEDTFSVGEKVMIADIEGVIERVDLRSTQLRAMTGELVMIPNGEIRVLRNFSRGIFSTADLHLSVGGADVARALPLLTELGEEAARAMPDLEGPWQIISKSGEVGARTQLTLLARTRFGRGADLRPQLMALVHERLSGAGIGFESGS